MTTSVKLNWKDPAGKLTGVEIAMKVDGAPDFTVLDSVLPGVQTLTIPDLVDGAYTFRATAINGSKRSVSPPTASITVQSVPGDVTAFVASEA